MKLLFDHNLSPKLVTRLNDLYPNSNYLYLMNLDKESDHIIWDIAKTENNTIVTKDSDFNELLILKGFPPKVIWIRLVGLGVNLPTTYHCLKALP
jgi:predicted nuclease of predicted toxin-antitoxin system